MSTATIRKEKKWLLPRTHDGLGRWRHAADRFGLCSERQALRGPQWCPQGSPGRHDDVQRGVSGDRSDRGGVLQLQPRHDVRHACLGWSVQERLICGPGVPGRQPHPPCGFHDDLRRERDREHH